MKAYNQTIKEITMNQERTMKTIYSVIGILKNNEYITVYAGTHEPTAKDEYDYHKLNLNTDNFLEIYLLKSYEKV